jgi:CMP-N-acetylneuraminic acid synthetase
MKIGSLILARSGSSFKDKNIIKIFGHPIMSYPMMAINNINNINCKYISTDSNKYIEIAQSYSFKGIIRPSNISTSTSSSNDAVEHAIKNSNLNNCDIIVVAHGNVITITDDIIINCINKLLNNPEYTSVIPAHRNVEYNPYRSFLLSKNDTLIPTMNDMYLKSPNRQDLPIEFFPDHSFWVIRTKNIYTNWKYTPWNCFGDNISYVETNGMFDIHDKNDIIKSEIWLKENKSILNYINFNFEKNI